jgi:hypothetical protein
MMLEPERDSELEARSLLQAEFGCELVRVPTGSIPTPDYREPSGRRSIEVKRLTSQQYRQLGADRNTRHWDSANLSGRWAVLIERSTLSSILEPVPPFPDDDPETIAYYTAHGFRVRTRAEREAEWRANHPGPAQPTTPRLKDLGRDLDPHLLILEQHGVTSTRAAVHMAADPRIMTALRFIEARTNGAICIRQDLLPGQIPGIDIALASSYVRTDRADRIVQRVELWLASSECENLKTSLANEIGMERHAVLVFDAGTEPEHRAATKQGLEFCPTIPISLPDEIDVLWLIVGPIACRYSPSMGWRSVKTLPDDQKPGRTGT